MNGRVVRLSCSPTVLAAEQPDVPALLAEHAENIGKLMAVSRPVLLGKRKYIGSLKLFDVDA